MRPRTESFCLTCMSADCPHTVRVVAAGPRLTAQQWRLIARLANTGAPNKILAYEMGLAEGTVKQYLLRAIEAIGEQFPYVTNRTSLVIWAVKHLPPIDSKKGVL